MMRQGLRIYLVCTAAFAAMALILFGGSQENTVPTNSENQPQPVLETLKIVRDVTPDEILQAPVIDLKVLERIPAKVQPKLPKSALKKKWWRPIVVSAGLIRSGDRLLRLSDINPIELDHECIADTGERWPCGRFAKTALARFVRGRTLNCDRAKPINEEIITRCRIGKQDLSRWLVTTGWARTDYNEFQDELEIAKSVGLGMWRKSKP